MGNKYREKSYIKNRTRLWLPFWKPDPDPKSFQKQDPNPSGLTTDLSAALGTGEGIGPEEAGGPVYILARKLDIASLQKPGKSFIKQR